MVILTGVHFRPDSSVDTGDAAAVSMATTPVSIGNGPATEVTPPSGAAAASVSPLERLDNLIKGQISGSVAFLEFLREFM